MDVCQLPVFLGEYIPPGEEADLELQCGATISKHASGNWALGRKRNYITYHQYFCLAKIKLPKIA